VKNGTLVVIAIIVALNVFSHYHPDGSGPLQHEAEVRAQIQTEAPISPAIPPAVQVTTKSPFDEYLKSDSISDTCRRILSDKDLSVGSYNEKKACIDAEVDYLIQKGLNAGAIGGKHVETPNPESPLSLHDVRDYWNSGLVFSNYCRVMYDMALNWSEQEVESDREYAVRKRSTDHPEWGGEPGHPRRVLILKDLPSRYWDDTTEARECMNNVLLFRRKTQ
jgi:hypothetical protein